MSCLYIHVEMEGYGLIIKVSVERESSILVKCLLCRWAVGNLILCDILDSDCDDFGMPGMYVLTYMWPDLRKSNNLNNVLFWVWAHASLPPSILAIVMAALQSAVAHWW